MLKKLALVVMLGISTLRATDAPKTGFIQKVKNSPAIVKVFAGIIPCIATFFCMDTIIKTYKDNPEWHNIADIAYYIKWTSLIIATIFYDWLFKINFRKWICERGQKSASISKSKIDVCDSVLLET